jgi:autotransporter-associated beta strand protein
MIPLKSGATFLFSCLILALPAQAGPGTSNPYGGKRVLVIGIDGLRPDALRQQVTTGNAPNIASLIANGTVTWNAYAGGTLGTPTQQPTISGPGWASILTGTWTNRHNVVSNSTPAYEQPTVPGSYLASQAPHFARRLKESAPATFVSSISSWGWVEDYLIAAQPTWVDHHTKGIGSSYPTRDADVTTKAVAQLGSTDPDVMFIHFDQVDGAGHSSGFSTTVPAYMTAITNVDTLIGNVLTAVTSRPQYASEQWLILLTTDHGGIGTGHGGQTPEERTIFFIVSGGGVPVGVSTASPGHAAIPATAMRYLGVGIPASWNLAEDGFVTGPSFAATRNAHSVQLTWAMPPNGIPGLTGYELRRNGSPIGTYTLAQTSATDSSPTSGTVTYQLVLQGTSEAALSQSVFVPGAGQLIWDDANPNNNWNTTDANWDSGDVFATGNQANFTGATGEVITVATGGVSPSETVVSGSGSYTFSGGSILTGPLTKTGGGALTLSGANSFTSATMNAGPDSQSSASAVIGNYGALGSGTITLGNSSSMTALYFLPATGTGTLANNVVLSSPTSAITTRLLMDETNLTATLSGLVSGGNANQELLLDNDSGSSDVGKIRLTNASNSFIVSRIRLNRGGLVVTSDGALGNPANSLTLDVTSGTAGSGLILEGSLTLGSGRTLSVASQTVVDTQATADILNGGITYTGQVVKRGSASLRLNAAGSGAGGFSLTEGSLALGNATALGTGSLTVATTAAAGFLDATPLPAVSTIANPIVLPADTTATNRTVLMTSGSGRELELSGVISGGNATNTTLYLNTSTTGDIAARFKLTGANTFLGKVQLNRGSLSINSNASFGAAANAVVINANTGSSLSFTAPMTYTHPTTLSTATIFDTAANTVDITAALAGTAGLTKTGTGTLKLSGTNTHTGAFTVSAGRLLVNGSIAASTNAVSISSAATLGGNGTVNRPVVNSGSIAPGDDAVGTLAVSNSLTLNPGSTLALDLSNWTGTAGAGHDSITATAISITATQASKFTVNLNTSGLTNFAEGNKSFVIATAGSPLTGLTASNWTVNTTGFNGTGAWSLRTTGNTLELVYTSVYSQWTSDKGLNGLAAAFDADPDGDGLPNGIEFVLGSEPNPANPGSNSPSVRPIVELSGQNLVFTFKRTDLSAFLNPIVEFNNDLQEPWTTAVDPGNASISVLDGGATDTVIVLIPKGPNAQLFARLRVSEAP